MIASTSYLMIGIDHCRPRFCSNFSSALKVIDVFEKEDPGGLLDVIELAATPGILVEDVIDILEGVLEHWAPWVNVLSLSAGPDNR